MKTLRFTLFLVLILISCQNQQIRSDLQKENLKGKVWKISQAIHETGGGCLCPAAEKTECNITKSLYDKHGNLVSSTGIDEDGKVAIDTKFIYNRYGMCTSIERYKGGGLLSKEIPELKGTLVTGLKIYDQDGVKNTTYKYTYAGSQITEEHVYDNEGHTTASIINEYDGGQLSKQTEKDASGNNKSISNFIRNSNNDITEMRVSLAGDTTMYRIMFSYEYDQEGNWIKKTQKYNGEIINIVTREIEYYED